MVDLRPERQRIAYGDDPAQFIDVVTPDQPCGTIVSIHGGYWRDRYGLDLHDPIVDWAVEAGWTTANIEYRRIPSDARERIDPPDVWAELSVDVLAALALAVQYGPRPHVVIGHSAGGQLALWATAQPEVELDAVIGLAPVSDLFVADGLELSDHVTKDLFGATGPERPDAYHAASPICQVPLGVPQLIIHGGADQSVPPEMTSSYVEAATGAGDEVSLVDPPSVDHFDVIDPTHVVWREVATFLDRLTQ